MKIKAAWGAPATIRLRLGAALAIALLPVLALGVAQSVLAFGKDAEAREVALVLGAERAAAEVRAKIETSAILLASLAPEASGPSCGQRLAGVLAHAPGYRNVIRFDRQGRVLCAAVPVSTEVDEARSPWFSALQAGDELIIRRTLAGEYGLQPSLLAAVPVKDQTGRPDGAMGAILDLAAIRPQAHRETLADAEVAIADGDGRILASTGSEAFTAAQGWTRRALAGTLIQHGKDSAGKSRAYAVSSLVSDDLFVLLSAPELGPWSWARVNLLSSILPPVLAFLLALAAVWVVSEQVVIRWLHYLQRIAAIYARGRFTVRPRQARAAPPEIRELAEALDIMADAIVARDQSLRESLAHKDGLMREIHHRVKNNLQVISSLVSMQQRSLSDPAAKAAMSDTRQRIAALALVYRALYQGPDLRRVDLKSFLEELIAQLIVPEGAHDHAVRTALSADDLIIEPDKLAPLALFAVEAITNAQKHAFAGRGGALRVDFKVEGERATLEIADDGTEDRRPELGAGVGRTLMTAFARQLGGQAEFLPNEQGGLTARLRFPTPLEIPPVEPDPPVKGKRNKAQA